MCINKKNVVIAGLFLATVAVAAGAGMGRGGAQQAQKQLNKEILPATKTVVTETGEKELLTRIVRVMDGDTFVATVGGKEEKVRLIGIDTPEVVDPRKPVQCFGKEASNKAKEVLNDRYVHLESDPTQSDRDKYGRLLRYVFLEDGMFFNEYMVREGYAYEYTYRMPYKYQKRFKAAQAEARDNKKGLWADGVCGNTALPVK